MAFGGNTSSEYRLASGFFLQSVQEQDPASRHLELQLMYTPIQYASIALAYVGVPYRPSTGAPADKQNEIAVEPRLQTGWDGVVFWGGASIGVRWLSLGAPSRAGNGVTYALESPKPELALSPRIGVDWILDGYTFGLEAIYTRETRVLKGQAIDDGTGFAAPMTVNQIRSWWTIEGRFGFQL